MEKRNLILYTFAIALLLFAQPSSSQQFPKSVINEMATRYMRYHHYLWHQVRENWNRFSDTTKKAFKDIGWEPPRPARTYDANGVASAILDNNSGEDFLYMHRRMIATANSIISKNNDPYGKIKGWASIPAPGNKTYPVPANYTIPDNPSTTSSTTNRKTDNYYTRTLKPLEANFKNYTLLRQMTLGELGARIEVTVHGYMHMRWSSASPYGYRNSYRGTIPYIDKKWDNVTYNWLGDSYASHVHPYFWFIHGWVDDRIEDWRKANGLSSIRWKGTWTGGPMSNLGSVMKKEGAGMESMSEGSENIDVLEKAFDIFRESGVPETTMGDEVLIDLGPVAPSPAVNEPTKPTRTGKGKTRTCRRRRH